MAGKRFFNMALRAALMGQPSLTMPTTAALNSGASSSRKSVMLARNVIPACVRHLTVGGPSSRRFTAGIYGSNERRSKSSVVRFALHIYRILLHLLN